MATQRRETPEEKEFKMSLAVHSEIKASATFVIIMMIADLIFKENFWDLVVAYFGGQIFYYHTLVQKSHNSNQKQRLVTQRNIRMILAAVAFVLFFVF